MISLRTGSTINSWLGCQREVINRLKNVPELVYLYVLFEVIGISLLRIGQQFIVEDDPGIYRCQTLRHTSSTRSRSIFPFRWRGAKKNDDFNRPLI